MGILDRIDLYLQSGLGKTYENSDIENKLVSKFDALYKATKSANESISECDPSNLEKWRKAYKGILNALAKDGTESTKKSRQLRKVCYEMIESKVDNSIPAPKIKPRYKSDIPLVDITENYLKFELDRMLTEYTNDKSERSTYIDGTSWYKVCWDSLDNTHERSGDLRIETRTVDQIYPQPGICDYKQLEYIFERTRVSISKIYDLYGRLVSSTDNSNTVEVISCYYLNENHVVGLFMYTNLTHQVICNEKDWQIRKLRKCTVCGTINPVEDKCKNCGNDKFKYENATEEILAEDLYEIYNPYEVGETDDVAQNETKQEVFITNGTPIPFYRIRQLPFVPRPAISSLDSLYGISEVSITLEMQDGVNKVLTKALEKTLKSGAVVTKPEKMKIGDTDETIKLFSVRTADEAQMVQSKQILADTSGDIVLSNILYDNAKSSSGITDSFQGKRDTTATSGKAKQYAAAQSAGRIESLRVMKSAAFAGVYELMLKYLLAFSDESRKFVKVLPDGSEQEMTWNKYMFLDKDSYGKIYYRDDFAFSTDTASTLSQNREAMWQETQAKFMQGAFGNPADPRALKLFWNTMDMLQYPLAKVALAGIKESERHLPPELEQAIMSNPEIMQDIVNILKEGQRGSGGARVGAGQKGNGATHAANVEKTNEKNRAANKSVITPNQQGATL